jgi:drug/metabolite transporter (DMT)-like permease
MALHQTTGRWRLGLTLALATAALWATLPVALKVALETIDPWTLTWARFGFAAVVVVCWLAWRGGLRAYAGHRPAPWLLLGVAGLLLVGNYLGYLVGLDYTTPANAQLLIQAAPLLMALGGILVFRERFTRGQWLGLAAVTLGLGLFFADQLAATDPGGSRYLLGVALVLGAALAWAGYALIQKQLLNHFTSTQVLAAIYVLATALLWPLAAPASLLELDALHAAALLFCALNTLGAYGAFAEALAHWEASRVSVVLATTPLLTVATVEAVHWLAPGLVAPEKIAWVGWVGAGLVVAGSVATSVLGARARARAPGS